jgi:hypothetical protein
MYRPYLRSVLEDDDDDEDEGPDYFDEEYEHQFTNGTPLHNIWGGGTEARD